MSLQNWLYLCKYERISKIEEKRIGGSGLLLEFCGISFARETSS